MTPNMTMNITTERDIECEEFEQRKQIVSTEETNSFHGGNRNTVRLLSLLPSVQLVDIVRSAVCV